eukprot:COSAG01_NODE_3561_length_5931_cov_4.674211_1_plen_1249_part_00
MQQPARPPATASAAAAAAAVCIMPAKKKGSRKAKDKMAGARAAKAAEADAAAAAAAAEPPLHHLLSDSDDESGTTQRLLDATALRQEAALTDQQVRSAARRGGVTDVLHEPYEPPQSMLAITPVRSSPRLAANPRRRKRHAPERHRRTMPYSHMSQKWRNRQLKADVGRVLEGLQDIARSEGRFRELITGLVRDSRVAEHFRGAVDELVPQVFRAITAGIKSRLSFLRDMSVHKMSIGRLVYDGIIGAAVSRLEDFSAVSMAAVADALGVDRRSVFRARQREVALKSGVPVLDPERAQRKDCISDENVAKIQDSWAQHTQPSPEMKIAYLTAADGTRLEHAVHYQHDTVAEMYDKMVEEHGKLCGLTFFTAQRPYFVHKPKWAHCLCPQCHTQRLLLDGYNNMLRDVRSESNGCSCSFCAHHRGNSQFPTTPSQLRKLILCAKAPCPPGHGFTKDTFPTHSLSCLRPFLDEKAREFIDAETRTDTDDGDDSSSEMGDSSSESEAQQSADSGSESDSAEMQMEEAQQAADSSSESDSDEMQTEEAQQSSDSSCESDGAEIQTEGSTPASNCQFQGPLAGFLPAGWACGSCACCDSDVDAMVLGSSDDDNDVDDDPVAPTRQPLSPAPERYDQSDPRAVISADEYATSFMPYRWDRQTEAGQRAAAEWRQPDTQTHTSDPQHECPFCSPKADLLFPPAHCEFMSEPATDANAVQYKKYVKVPRHGTTDGSTRDQLTLTQLPRAEFLEEFRSHFSTYLLHRYVCDWEDAIAEGLIAVDDDGHQVIGKDFGMNYTCIPGEEPKQGFFQREQVSLHTYVCYGPWPPGWATSHTPGGAPRGAKMGQSHIYLSNDNHHDPAYVQHNNTHLLKFLQQQRHDLDMPPIRRVSYLSDGGPAHYKCRRSMYNFSHVPDDPAFRDAGAEPLLVDWIFLGPNHGKSNWDGMTGIFKNKCRRASLYKKETLETDSALVAFGNRTKREKAEGEEKVPFKKGKNSTYTMEHEGYWHTPSDELELVRSGEKDVSALSGIRTHYHYRFLRAGLVHMRWLGCMCDACWREDWGAPGPSQCLNLRRVGAWSEHELKASDTAGVSAVLVRRRALANDMQSKVRVGDTVAIITGADVCAWRVYWLAEVVAAPAPITQPRGVRCPETGDSFAKGEVVLTVKYLDRIGDTRREDNLFERRYSDEYIVSVKSLRYGGQGREIWLVDVSIPAPARRCSARHTAPPPRPALELVGATADAIAHTIHNVCEDEVGI